jgi:hypothetical protein
MDNLLLSKSATDTGNRQAAATPSTFNAVAQLVHWGHDGVVRLKLLTDVPGAAFGEEILSKVQENQKRMYLLDFDYRRRKDRLRTGGTVLLRKVVKGEDGVFVCREVEVMCPSTKEGPCVVNRAAAVYLHQPAGTTLIPNHATVATLRAAAPVRSIEEAREKAVKLIEEVKLFGEPSLVITGLEPDGSAIELPVRLSEGDRSPDAIRRAVSEWVDPESAGMMKKVKKPWIMVPMFRIDLDPENERRSKMSAQRANLEYGTDDEPFWTRSNVVLRGKFDDWFVADTSPIMVPRDNTPKLLLDLLAK